MGACGVSDGACQRDFKNLLQKGLKNLQKLSLAARPY